MIMPRLLYKLYFPNDADIPSEFKRDVKKKFIQMIKGDEVGVRRGCWEVDLDDDDVIVKCDGNVHDSNDFDD